jgi:WD40 repeat protein
MKKIDEKNENENEEENEEEKKSKNISDFSCFPSKNLFISSSTDGFVKIWNCKKEKIREIKFPEEVYSVNFQNDSGDILVGHHGKVSMVTAEDYGL